MRLGFVNVVGMILFLLAGNDSAAAGHVVEIARGHSWVSPYWGYSSPKIVSDGKTYYTAGIWGDKPDSAEGVLYKYDEAVWHAGARFSNIYQPVSLTIDKQGRVIVVYTEQLNPVHVLRAKKTGDIDELEPLPSPPDMKNAYYIGIALREDTLFLAYIATPDYSMWLTTLNLSSLEWSPSRLVCQGQIEHKPKTAWTYPIVYPGNDGLHLVASNSPDGGEGNTYNQVWYVFYPYGAQEPSIREMVASTTVGHIAYATDFALDTTGACHILFMFNQHSYGVPLPQDSPPAGIYEAWRNTDTGKWQPVRLGPAGISGFFESAKELIAVTSPNTLFRWQGPQDGWKEAGTLCETSLTPGPIGFFDVISRASGSDIHKGAAVVSDSLLPGKNGLPEERVIWSVLPE